MRTRSSVVARREHDRLQLCGPGRSEPRLVRVRGTDVTLSPTDPEQIGLLETIEHRAPARPGIGDRPRRSPATTAGDAGTERPVLRSYWRMQPHGPGRSLRRMTLIDVRA